MSISFSELSVVIPCFNEEATIGAVLDRLLKHCPQAEVLVVDDGSTDRTTAEVSHRPCVRLLRHDRNRGYGAAIRTGCAAATRPYIVWFDADGQHAPEMIDLLLEKLPYYDCVIGARTGKSTAPWIRQAGVGAIAWLARLLTMRRIPDLNCGLRVFRREKLLPYLNLLPEGFSASATTSIVMLETGHRVAWSNVERLPRQGSSRLQLVRDGLRTLRLVVRLIIILNPWKLIGPLAIALGLFGALAGVVAALFSDRTIFWISNGLFLSAGIAVLLGIIAYRRSRNWRQRLMFDGSRTTGRSPAGR